MTQSRKDIVKLFKEDISNASRDEPDDGLFSEWDEVCILYYGHYPEYKEDFDEIVGQNPQFFDFG